MTTTLAQLPTTAPPTRRVATLTALGFAAAGLGFALFPLLRPWSDEQTASPETLAAFASGNWVAAHLAGITALGLLAPALLGLRRLLTGSRGHTLAGWALAAAWLGAAGSALFWGAETFGINTLARLAGPDGQWLSQIDAIRNDPLNVAIFGAGLLLIAAAGVLTFLALARAGHGALAAPFGLGLVTFLPQFYFAPPVRIGHGLLLGIGCLLVAVVATRLRRQTAG